MFNWINNIRNTIRNLNKEVSEYQKDTIIQALPSLALVNKAKKLIEEHKFKEAEEILFKAQELPQQDSLVYKYLGLIYDKTFRLQDAVDMYQKSADLNPEDKIIWQKLGFALVGIQEFDRAEKAFDNANKVSPCNTDTFTGWGMALMKGGEYTEAREKFIEAAKFNRYNFTAIFLTSIMEIKLEMYDDAEVKLKFLTGVSPNEANNYELAHLKFLRHDIQNTIYYAKKALEYNPNMLPAYLMLGQCYALNTDEEALSYFLQAEQKNLINENLYLEWGIALIKFSRNQEAKHYLLKAFEINSEMPEIIENLALCNLLLKDMKDAPPLIEKLKTIKPQSSVLQQIEGILQYMNGDFSNAILTLKTSAERLEQNNYINYYYMAKSSIETKDYAKAKDYFDTALLKNPKYTIGFIDYAKFLISQNNFAEAQRKLRKVNKYEQNNVEVLNLMFYVSYILVKENTCEYNIKETISISKQIPDELFEYKTELNELIDIQNQMKSERD